MRSGFAPAHARSFEPLIDDRFASALDHSRADEPTIRFILGIVHPMGLIAEVAQHRLDRFAQAWFAFGPVPLLPDRQQRPAAFLFQQTLPLNSLLHGFGFI